jgi:hypothetical protein
MKVSLYLKSLPLIIAILVGFGFAFFEHVSVPMYLLSAVIFYFYLPMLYSYSRVNVLYHVKAKEFMHLKYYPMEFLFWLLATCFFSFILAHLIADLSFGAEKPIHFIIYLLAFIYPGIIFYREISTKKLHNVEEQINYERQGRLISFEVLFVFILLFMMKH